MEKPKISLEQLQKFADIAQSKETMSQLIQAKTPEGKEIVFDLEKERQAWQEFYDQHHLKTHIPDIKLNPEQIKELQNLIEKGYIDDLAIIADELSYPDIEREMTQGYEETFAGSDFDTDGGLATLDQQETKQGFLHLSKLMFGGSLKKTEILQFF